MATWLEGNGSSTIASCPNSANLQITGDLDLRIRARAVDWSVPPASAQMLIARRQSTDGSLAEWEWSTEDPASTGTKRNRIRWWWDPAVNTNNTTQITSINHAGVDGEWLSLRMTLDVDNGGGGYTVTFYEKSDADIVSDSGWTQTQQFVTAAGITLIRSKTTTVEVGSRSNGLFGFIGGVAKALIVQGLSVGAGTVRASPDFTALSAGATSYTDAQSNVWTFGAGATIASEAQIARPAADTSVGSWLTHTGASTNLFATLDEVNPDDSDYIRSPTDPSNAPCVVKLGPLTDPAISTGHIVRYRYLKSGSATIDLVAQLRQGYVSEGTPGTLIASATHTNISASAVTAALTLTGGEADAITNYGDLYLRFVANKTA